MFRLAYNANGLRDPPLTRAIQEVAAAGYDAIELSLHASHIDPFRFTRRDAEQVRAALDAAGIPACCLAAGADDLLGDVPFEPSLIHPTEAGRQVRVDLLLRAIEIAQWLGIPVINFASGRRQDGVTPEQADRYLGRALRRLSTVAGAAVVLAMEPEPGFFVETNAAVGRLRERLGVSNFELCQDLGHCRVVEDDYQASVARWLPITAYFQVEDIKGRRHHHEIPGDGDLDFAGFFGLLRAGGYTGYLSVELYNHGTVYREALRRSLEVLRAAELVAPAQTVR